MMAKEKLDSLLLRARDSFDVECISPPPLLAALPHPSPGDILLLLDKNASFPNRQPNQYQQGPGAGRQWPRSHLSALIRKPTRRPNPRFHFVSFSFS